MMHRAAALSILLPISAALTAPACISRGVGACVQAITECLVRDGESADNSVDAALRAAAGFSNKPELVEALLDRGANPHAVDDSGRTAFHYAALSGRSVAVVKLLVESVSTRNKRLAVPLSLPGTAATVTPTRPWWLVQDQAGKTPMDYARDNKALAGVFTDSARN